MPHLFIGLLRFGIAAAILVGLFGQLVVIPATVADEVARVPAYAPFAALYVVVAVLGVLCVQVVMAATWMLLDLVRRDVLFTSRAFRWVDTVIGASVVATLLAFGMTGHFFFAQIPVPTMELIGALGASATAFGLGAAFAMLVVVMRGLLRKATDLRSEIADVI